MSSIDICTPHALRVQRIDTDSMEPTLVRGDYVLLKPCTEFEVDAPYLIDVGGGMAPYIVSGSVRGTVWLTHANSSHQDGRCMTRQEFAECVVGRVVAELKAIDRHVIREAAA